MPSTRPPLAALVALCAVLALAAFVPVAAGAGHGATGHRPATDPAFASAQDGTTTGENGTTAADAGNATVTNVTVRTAPRAVGEWLDDPAAVAAARRDGALTRDVAVARTDALVLTLRSDGLTARVNASDGPNETVRFVRATNGSGSAVRLVQTNPTVERRAKVVGLHRPGAMTVVADAANDTSHLVVDLTSVRVGRRDRYGVDWHPRGETAVRAGDEFALNVTLDGRTFLFDASERGFHDPVVQVVEPEAAFGTGETLDRVALAPSSEATIRGTTSLAPGTTVHVRIANRSDGGPPVDLRTRVVERQAEPEGRDRFEPPTHEVRATVDATGFARDATFDATLGAGGEPLARTRGVVRARRAAVSLPATETWRDGVIRVPNATLSAGGFLVVQAGDRQELSPPDGILYRGHVAFDPGTYRDVTVAVDTGDLRRLSAPLPSSVTVVAVADTNGNGEYDAGDEPYVANGTAVADVARIENPRPAPGDVRTPEPTPTTPTTTGRGGATATVAAGTTVTTTTGAGFGVVPTALAVLAGSVVLAAAATARRRERR